MIRSNNGPDGKLSNFELGATYVLPYDLVATRKSNNIPKDSYASVSGSISATFSILTSSKPTIRKTVVCLR